MLRFSHRRALRRVLFVVVLFGPALASALPGEKMSGTEFFERKVRPLLVKHCYECHSEQEGEQKGGLLLDRESGWLEGGDTGKAVVPGQIGASLLIEAVLRVDEDSAMPPKYALEEEEIAVLKKWIRDGAAGPAEDMGETEFSQLGDQEVIFGKARDHWSFQPVAKVEPPKVDHPTWSKHPVDRFLFAKLKEKGLAPSPRADARTLTRRLSYDLTGLPPTDESLFALNYEGAIDKLLSSDRFGEHVARMWLDVARYADTAGTYRPDTRTPHYYPFAFTYRDYVIDAFNADKPFDLFVREQLAADLMGVSQNSKDIAALGFLGVSPIRNMSPDYVDDVIDATTRGFMGLTVSCSRCHDHKFEPIPTADYYSLYGVFASVERPEPWKLDQFPEIDGYDVEPATLTDYEKARAAIDKEIAEAGDKKRKGNNRSLADSIEQTKLAELLLFHDGAPARAMTVSEKKNPVNPFVFLRGEASQRGDRVPRRFLKILDPEQEAFDKDSSGRLEVAEKITDPMNPLTSRVFVNRIWGMLMGDFLVDTPSDFGLQGEEPSHPELLDWLANDFIESGWSTKHLVRTIVTSEAYRQRSDVHGYQANKDPENDLYWRANRDRLSIEELRDSLLAVSGELEEKVGGRSEELWGDEYTKRRSLYGYINRFNLDPTLRNFDFPSPMQTQGERNESIVAPQALFMMNSPFVTDQAQAVVEKSVTEEMKRPQRIEAIYQQVFHRSPREDEIERIGRFADIEEGRDVDPWPLLAQSLFMSNEFLYVD